MNTFLGASSYLSPDDVDEASVRSARFVYLEGYMWDRPAAKEAFRKAGRIARAAGNARRADAVGFVLRRPLPRRVHRPDALGRRRHGVRQHRRGAVALRDAASRRGARRVAPRRACSPSSRARRRARSSSRATARSKVPAFPIAQARRHDRRGRSLRRRLPRGPGARRRSHGLRAARRARRGRNHPALGARPAVVAGGAGARQRAAADRRAERCALKRARWRDRP